LEVAVAKSYEIKREMFDQILCAFPKVLPDEREKLLDSALWSVR